MRLPNDPNESTGAQRGYIRARASAVMGGNGRRTQGGEKGKWRMNSDIRRDDMTKEILRFNINTPIELALRWDDGKRVEGRYGDQIMFTLNDNRVMYYRLL